MTATTAWAHLPNARYIDAVLADVKARPEVWKAARDAAWGAARSAAGYAVRSAARSAAGYAVWDAAQGAGRSAALDAARSAAWDAAWAAVWNVIRALVAWDSAADLLDLSPAALRVLIDVAPAPVCHQAVMLLPWAIVKHTEEVTPM